MAHPRRILVICTANRCRSQIAEGWLRHFAGDSGVEVLSAGTAPQGVHPLAIEVMAEAGVDISGQRSQHVDEFKDQAIDWVVTVCDRANKSCPTYWGTARGAAAEPCETRLIHQPFVDPDRSDLGGDELLDTFHRVRDQIRDWARGFIAEMSDVGHLAATGRS